MGIKRALGLLAVLILAAAAARAAAPGAAGTPAGGFSISIVESTQMRFGGLSIGVGDMGREAYRDKAGRRRVRRYANLSLVIAGNPKSFRQVDAVEGQTLILDGYRVLVQKILPEGARGSVIVQVRVPAPKPKSWLSRLLERL